MFADTDHRLMVVMAWDWNGFWLGCATSILCETPVSIRGTWVVASLDEWLRHHPTYWSARLNVHSELLNGGIAPKCAHSSCE